VSEANPRIDIWGGLTAYPSKPEKDKEQQRKREKLYIFLSVRTKTPGETWISINLPGTTSDHL